MNEEIFERRSDTGHLLNLPKYNPRNVLVARSTQISEMTRIHHVRDHLKINNLYLDHDNAQDFQVSQVSLETKYLL